jgi:hypothetical protein
MPFAFRVAILTTLVLPAAATAQSRRLTGLSFLTPFSTRPPLHLGHHFAAQLDTVGVHFEPQLASPGPAQRCPMPILSSDSSATRSMPVIRPDTTLVARMPTARFGCRNPLWERPKKP